MTRRKGDTLIHGCERGIFALTAMQVGAFSSPTFVGFSSPVTNLSAREVLLPVAVYAKAERANMLPVDIKRVV